MNRREQKTIVDGINFGSVFQFQSICGAIASSMQPARLLIALGMVLVLLATGKLWDSVAGVSPIPLAGDVTYGELQQQREFAIAQSATVFGHSAPDGSELWTVHDAQSHLIEAWRDYLFEGDVSHAERDEFEQLYLLLEKIRPLGPFEASSNYISTAWTSIVDAGLNFDPVGMWRGVVSIVWELPQMLWQGGFHWFMSVYGFLLIYVLCIGGGAIARMQACWHSRTQRLSVGEAIDFSLLRWQSLLTAILGPAMFVAVVTIMLMLMGLILMNIPWLNLIGGLLYGISLLLGFLVAVVVFGYAACCPMIIPAVVIEDCSGGDAVQRSFAYLFSRALHYLGYLIVLIICLVLGFVVVRLIANLTLDITANLVGEWTFNTSLLGAGSLQESAIPTVGTSWYETSAGWLIGIWEVIVHDLMIGWIFSGFFSGSAMLYLLMRKTCDGQDSRDIWWEGLIQGSNVPDSAARED